MDPVLAAVLALAGAVLGGIGGYAYRGVKSKALKAEVEQDRLRLEAQKSESEKQALEIIRQAELQAKEDSDKKKDQLDRELRKRRAEMDRTESRLKKREEQLDRRDEALLRREEGIEGKEKRAEQTLGQAQQKLARIEEQQQEYQKRLEAVANMSAEEGKQRLLLELEKEVRQEAGALIRQIEAETREQSDRKCRQIITLAMQKAASDQVAETAVSVINLPNEEMKGKIIGREGRNIRALEQATGVNIIVDDTPEAVVLSCFDPMRREIARRVIDKLIADGRIHPTRIEEIVEKMTKQVLEEAREAGEAACLELQIFDIHPELVKLMGRLKYRTSYGQNILAHSVEVARIGEVIASELGLDAKTVKRSCFLHDIGKAVSYEVEGPHAAIGAQLAKKHREKNEVVHAIEAHHFEVEPRTLTAMVVITADSVSASRPGARRESFESYVKRLEQLETICREFDGVEKAYAVQAGREVRIVVQPDKLNDDECAVLARDVTKRIEGEMQYPGQIKVTVLRETRKVEFAR